MKGCFSHSKNDCWIRCFSPKSVTHIFLIPKGLSSSSLNFTMLLWRDAAGASRAAELQTYSICGYRLIEDVWPGLSILSKCGRGYHDRCTMRGMSCHDLVMPPAGNRATAVHSPVCRCLSSITYITTAWHGSGERYCWLFYVSVVDICVCALGCYP